MRKLLCLTCTLVLVLGASATVRADDRAEVRALLRGDDQAEARAFLEKAIKARGGEANLTKFKAFTSKVKGQLHIAEEVLDFTGEWSVQGAEQSRLSLGGEFKGVKFHNERVINGDKSWIKENDNLKESDKDTLANDKEQLYGEWITSLVPLLDKEFQLAPLGESKVGDRTAVGLKVSRKGHADVNLFIDKEKGVVLKRELGDAGAILEVLYSDFKDVQGVQRFHKISYKIFGKPFIEMELSEIKLQEKLDDKVFVMAGAAPAAGSFKRTPDVIYGRKFGTALTLDVFAPTKNANGAAIIAVVSGGWYSDHAFVEGGMFRDLLIDPFVQRGYTVFAVVHGSQPRYTIPEAVSDINRAVRFIRSHAKDYQIDPDRIGITGASAGGHLSLMQGTAGDVGNPKAADPVDRASSRVQAVACFYPPTDFLNYGDKDKYAFGPDGVLAAFRIAIDVRELDPKTKMLERVSEDKLREIARQVSPIAHVSADTPPTLIIHGEKDVLVPIQQAEAMVAKLKEAKVPAELVVKKGAGHGWADATKDVPTLGDWFDKYLTKK